MAMERHTFHDLKLKSVDVNEFTRLYNAPGRRRVLRQITYGIVLLSYSVNLKTKFEREEDRRANDEAFTAALFDLFTELASWDKGAVGTNRRCDIRLEIKTIASPSDHLSSSGGKYPRLTPKLTRPDDADATLDRDLGNRRFMYSSIRLLR